MIRVQYRLALCTANRDAGTILGVRETRLGAAKAAHQFQNYFLLIHRRENSIHVVERLAELQARIVALGWLESCFYAQSEALGGHHISSDTQEKTTQIGSLGASGIRRTN